MVPEIIPVLRARGWLSGPYDIAEAFTGSGVLSLSLLEGSPEGRPRSVQMWDAVSPLLTTHATIRSHPEAVCEEIRALEQAVGNTLTRSGYEQVRERLNAARERGAPAPALAAAFLVCNWAGYNGLWRTNAAGGSNTSWGKWSFESDWGMLCAQVVRTSLALRCAPLHTRIWDARKGQTPLPLVPERTILFVDPPYAGTYSGYAGAWGAEDFAQLQAHLLRWAAAHVRVVVTFPLAEIRLLPVDWPYTVLSVPNLVGGTKSQRNVREEVLMLSPLRIP